MALNRFGERVREGVMIWLDNGLTEDFEVDGVTDCDILDELNGSMFQTLCIMNIRKVRTRRLSKNVPIKTDLIKDVGV